MSFLGSSRPGQAAAIMLSATAVHAAWYRSPPSPLGAGTSGYLSRTGDSWDGRCQDQNRAFCISRSFGSLVTLWLIVKNSDAFGRDHELFGLFEVHQGICLAQRGRWDGRGQDRNRIGFIARS